MLTNARKDEVEAFLNLFTDWRWRGNVISGRVKASLVGSIMDGDQLPFWTRIWETSLLNQCFSLFLAFAYFLDVTTLLGDNIVSRFITMNKLFTSHFKLHSSKLYFNMYVHRNVVEKSFQIYKYIFKYYYMMRFINIFHIKIIKWLMINVYFINYEIVLKNKFLNSNLNILFLNLS